MGDDITADTTARPPGGGLRKVAAVLASLVIATPLLVGRMVEAILDTVNPAGVDVTQPLAYLSEILAWGFGSLALLLIVLVVVFVLAWRRARSFAGLGLALLILVLQIVAGVTTLLLSSATDGGNTA